MSSSASNHSEVSWGLRSSGASTFAFSMSYYQGTAFSAKGGTALGYIPGTIRLLKQVVVVKVRRQLRCKTRGLSEFAPVSLFQFHFVFLCSGLDAFPRRVAFGVRHPFHLLEARDCVAHVGSVMDGFFTFLGESEVFIADTIAFSFSDLGHAWG